MDSQYDLGMFRANNRTPDRGYGKLAKTNEILQATPSRPVPSVEWGTSVLNLQHPRGASEDGYLRLVSPLRMVETSHL